MTPEQTATTFIAQRRERAHIAKELHRIEILRRRHLATWEDTQREHRLRRRLVDLDLAAEEVR